MRGTRVEKGADASRHRDVSDASRWVASIFVRSGTLKIVRPSFWEVEWVHTTPLETNSLLNASKCHRSFGSLCLVVMTREATPADDLQIY